MKSPLSWMTALLALVTACGGTDDGTTSSTSTSSTASASTAAWTDTAMQSLVATKCATSSCHGGAEQPNMKGISEAAMKADTQALAEVLTGKMPKGGSLTTAEKTTFVAFYAAQ